ncbi:MAG: hypothetical protein H0T13_01740 [Actinobacteria bacterium]|nr:hypothetical protein [Actinomycetota bacterium]
MSEQGERVEWPLRDVSFEVARGEAIGIVSRSPAGPQALARILAGMTAPTSGRIVARGRVGPSVELATLLTRRENHPRRVARSLARVLGIPRRRRRAYIDQMLRLSAGDAPDALLSVKQRIQQVALAAAFDPLADVLVVDDFPARSDSGFQRRCHERLEGLLERGAAAVVTAANPELILRLCPRAVLLEDGAVVRIGPAEDVIAELGRSVSAEPVPAGRPRRLGFNAHAALLAVEILDEAGRPMESARTLDEPRVAISFETAQGSTSIGIRAKLTGARTHAFAHDATVIAEPGRYIAVLRLAAGSVGEGDYTVTVDLAVTHEGERTTIGRRASAAIRFEGFGDDGGTLAEETDAPPGSTRSAAEPDWTIEPDLD